MTRKEEVEKAMRELGISRIEAEFLVAIERGEIDGDIIVLDAEGRESE